MPLFFTAPIEPDSSCEPSMLDNTTEIPLNSAEPVSRSSGFAGRFLSNPLVLIGLAIVVVLALAAVSAPALSKLGWLRDPLGQSAQGLDEDGMPLPMGAKAWLGTDNLGRDVLSRVLFGTRVSLTVGVASMLTATVIGLLVGLASGYVGGGFDIVLMRFTEMNLTLPAVLLAVALAGVLNGRVVHLHPPGLDWHWLDLELKRGMASLFLIIGLVSWPGMVRVIRAEVLSIKEREFVLAARALGASDLRIVLRHILPNILPTVIVLSAMTTAGTILLEAGLGYLGIGVPPPSPSWGSMINEGQPYFVTAPHLVIVPGLAIVVTVLAFNFLGQGLQEVLNPKRAD